MNQEIKTVEDELSPDERLESKNPPENKHPSTESALRQALTDKESILNAAGEGIYGIDLHGKATFINPAAIAMTGWSEQETIGTIIHQQHHHSYSDGSDYPSDLCPIYATLKDGKVYHGDNEVFWHKKGFSFPVEYTSTPIYKNEKLAGAVVVFKDITQRKNNELKLQQANTDVQKMMKRLAAENIYLQEEIQNEHNFKEIVGQSNAINQLLKQIKLVAPTQANVLISGESGTGKELIARAIHKISDRSDHPLICVNCAAIAPDLFESEFFGHVKGAFTGAIKDRIGRFELANGGTIFLDEVGEIPLAVQGKLLRVLQDGFFERVGEEKSKSVDVRIIAATNKKLEQEVKTNNFREDLYFRLNVFPIEAIPLRNRVEDIPALAQHFIKLICGKLKRSEMQLTKNNVEQLQAYPWRGNIRELQNVIERAIILSSDNRLQFGSLANEPEIHSDELTSAPGISNSNVLPFNESERLRRDRENIINALNISNHKISGKNGAAEILGIRPTTLASRMKKLNISKKD